jgi:hypothetical protein
MLRMSETSLNISCVGDIGRPSVAVFGSTTETARIQVREIQREVTELMT